MTTPPIRKGYADTPRGQIHFRRCRPDNASRALVVMHWSPGSGRMYEPFMPGFAARGYDVVAPDLPGMGRSDARDGDWAIADFADTIAAALTALDLSDICLVAGHMSAAVGTEMILRHPGLVAKVVLDGSPAWTEEERAAILKRIGLAKPSLQADGSHKTLPWDRAVFALTEWDNTFEVTDDNLLDVYLMAVDYLEMRFETPAGAIGRYKLTERLPELDLPVLALTADNEILRKQHDTVLSLVKGCAGHSFPGSHPLVAPARAKEYVDVIDTFFRA